MKNQDFKDGHITLVLSSLEIGGAQRVMLHLMNGFVKIGLKVDAVLVKASGPFLNQIPQGVNLVDLGAKRTLTAIPAFVHYLRKNQPDVVLSGLTHINIAVIIAHGLSGLPCRLVVCEHSNLSHKKPHAKKFMDKLANFLINFLYSFADAVVAVSKDVANDLIESTNLDPKKIIPIYNPIPVDTIRESSIDQISHPWFSGDRAPVILAVGRLSKPKDYPTLIRAFNILRNRKFIRLMIIGEGEERSTIEKLVHSSPFSDDISLMGKINNPFPYMAGADVFVLSSAWEGFGLVLVEALACGASVVSTDCHSGPAETLENGKYGRLVPVGDARALADAIEQSLDHPFPPEQSIARARDFSVDKAVQQYLKVLLPNHKTETGNL